MVLNRYMTVLDTEVADATTANVTTGSFTLQRNSIGMHVAVFRNSADPGVAANVNLELQVQVDADLDEWAEWADSGANFDFDTGSAFGWTIYGANVSTSGAPPYTLRTSEYPAPLYEKCRIIVANVNSVALALRVRVYNMR